MIQKFLFLFLSFNFSYATFYIDYDNNTFSLDGKPFQYISGSAHYFRMPRQYWRDRLRKLRQAGLNAVSTYVEWSQHEAIPGEFNFEGELDIQTFIKTAQEEDLYVILRPGPYICAEREMGGLPYWLLQKHPEVYLRTMDPRYTKYVERWMNVLFDEIKNLLHGKGGPIILVQVENEYGSYPACDVNYGIWLRDLFKKHVIYNAVLFTTDGMSVKDLKCGKIPEVYATVDFGVNTNVRKAFEIQRKFEKKGPLVCSEFYPGWLTHWGEEMAHVDVTSVIKTFKTMIKIGANVNFYMFYGGTNFGFTAGADYDEGAQKYQSVITSYDYDAPITESGELTLKYFAIRDLIAKYAPENIKSDISSVKKRKFRDETIVLKKTAELFSNRILNSVPRYLAPFPVSFEALNQNGGYCMYATNLADLEMEHLNIETFHDYANIFVDGKFSNYLLREFNNDHSSLIKKGKTIQIIVENLGRINYGGRNNDTKGILSNVTHGRYVLKNWNISCFDFKNLKPLQECLLNNTGCLGGGFKFYMAMFNRTNEDFYIDVSSLNKGLVFVNNYNLGRYWSSRGPQYALYVPQVYLKDINLLIIMDEISKKDSISVRFISNKNLIRFSNKNR